MECKYFGLAQAPPKGAYLSAPRKIGDCNAVFEILVKGHEGELFWLNLMKRKERSRPAGPYYGTRVTLGILLDSLRESGGNKGLELQVRVA